MGVDLNELTDNRGDPASRMVLEDYERERGWRPTRLGVALSNADADADADADDDDDGGLAGRVIWLDAHLTWWTASLACAAILAIGAVVALAILDDIDE
jgi:hypothetical protein